MAKEWVITLEPSDKSAPKRVVERLSGRKKIAEIETYLQKLYAELHIASQSGLIEYTKRISGVVVTLEKEPSLFTASLSEI